MAWVLGCPEGHVESILHRQLSDEEKKLNDEILFDGAGYVPLDIRIKQMERAGMRLASVVYDNDIASLRESYEIAEFEPDENDSVDDIVAKELARSNYYAQKMNEKLKKSSKSSPHEGGSLNEKAESPIVENSEKADLVSE